MQSPPVSAVALETMHDIVTPDPVSRALDGPGWVVLGALALILIAAIVWRAIRRWRANAYRRAALGELALLEARVGERDAATLLSALVKRTALAARPREDVAKLSGRRWLEELDSMWGRDAFQNGAGRVLADAAYGGAVDETKLRQAVAVVRDWIRSHHARV